jgi:hypothetical protein
MGTGRLKGLLKTTAPEPRSTAEVSEKIISLFKPKAVLRLLSKSKGKSPMVSPDSAPGDRRPTLNIDTRPLFTVGSRQSYGAIGERQTVSGSLQKCKNNPETHRNGRPLFDVAEEVEDGDLEALLEEEGLYLGSLPSFATTALLDPTYTT